MRQILIPSFLLLTGWALFFGQASPDLTVEAISTAGVATDSQTLAVSGSLTPTIRNLGAGAASSFLVRVYEDRNSNAVYNAGVDALLGSTTIASLGAGATAAPSIPLSGTLQFAGNILYVHADAANAVTESNESNNTRHSGQGATFTPGAGGLNPSVLWERRTFTVLPTSRRVTSPLAVGDLDGDGFPEIVFSTYVSNEDLNGHLRILDGRTGAEKFTQTDPALEVRPTAGISLGDIDADGRPEIVTLDEACQVIAFEHDGVFKWRGAVSVATGGRCFGGVNIADLNRDGTPEIVAGRRAYSNTGALLWTGTGLNGGDLGPLTYAVDLSGDANLEVVVGPTVYNSTGGILFNRSATYAEAYSATADIDGDGLPEIVFKPRLQQVAVALENDGTTKWSAPWPQGGGGPPTIGNFDSDPEPEIGIAALTEYRVYEANGTLKWTNSIIDSSSGVTSSTIFDFDNDGIVEVVFADQEYLYIWRGTDGFELFRASRPSATGVEMPVVADVDGNGHADIVVPYRAPGVAGSGIAVYYNSSLTWAKTRKVWNQPSYSITHINDNLTIPTTFTPNWLSPGLNNFLLNTFLPGTGSPTAIGDFTISYLRRNDAEFPAKSILAARVGNGGAADLVAASVQFRLGSGGPLLCSTATTVILAPGAFQDVSCEYLNPTPGPQTIVATVDPANLLNEADENNNAAGALLTIGLGPNVTVSGLTVRARDAAIDLKWTPIPGAAAYNIYRRAGSNPYALHRAAYVNALGAFADTGLTNNTVYSYQVRWLNSTGVESAPGTEASAMPIPRTQRNDTAPTITSLPVTQARAGALYQYQMLASDPDAGQTKTFEIQSPPTGLTIHPTSGLIQWTPLTNQAGTHRILASVRDSRNRVTIQYFDVFVETQLINTAPSITSSPISSAIVGRPYAYTMRASDPDAGDLLTFFFSAAPFGMGIHPTTGVLSWTPSLAQTGPHNVIAGVRDLAGFTRLQSFTIQVTNPNRQPTITSTAPTAGAIGNTYSYTPAATDPDPGDILSWSLVEAPTGATINSASGLVLFNAAAPGAYPFTIEVADLLGAFHRQSFTVNIAAIVNNPPVFTSTPPTNVEAGQSLVYQAAATDPEADTILFSLVSGPNGMAITPTGRLTWTIPNNAAGSQNVVLRAADPSGASSQQAFTLTIAPIDTTPPTISILSPANDALVAGEVPVTGTVTDANLVSWKLEYQISGGASWVLLNEGTTPVTNGPLGVLPATLLANNPYVLRLSAFDRRQGLFVQNIVRVGGDTVKLGAFTLDYTDLRLPSLGLPLTVQRRYDSRKPYWNDFGSGWALGFSQLDLRTDANYNAYVTLPSGREAIFAFTPVMPSPVFPTLENRYTAPPGVDDKLENLDCPAFLGGGQGLACLGGDTPFAAYSPKRWRLTTKEGTIFTLDHSVITRIEDRAGNWMQITPTGITSSDGRNVQFQRDGSARITQITDARGYRHLYAYDSLGRLIQHTDPANKVTLFEYAAASHRISRIVGPGGCEAVRQEFDAAGRLSARIDSAGLRTEYTYDLPGRRLIKLLPGPITTIETYDAAGNVLSFQDGEGQLRQYAYDASGRRTLTIMPSGRRIARTFDANGNPATEEDGPNGGPFLITSYQWTPENLLARITRPNGDYQTFSYNTLGNLTHTRIFNAATTQVEEQLFTYDAQGRLLSEAGERGIFQYSYDAAGNLFRITDGAGRIRNFVYDSTGNIVTAYNGAGERFDRSWDGYGLPGPVTIAGALFRTQSWNEFGLPAATGNALGQSFQFAYSCSGELSQVTDPLNGLTRYTRNGLGSITAMVDALNRTTAYTYDRNGLRTSRTSPAGDVHNETYTPDGNLASSNTGLGPVQFTYDAYGRKLTESTAARTETFSYDTRGRVTSIVSTGVNPGTMSFTHNAANRLTSVTDRFGHTVSYTYDSFGRRASMTAPDGAVTTYLYDASGRISRITTGANWAEYSYDSSARRSGLLYSNGVRAAYTWDPRGRLASLAWYSPSSTVIRSWNYSYDAAGRRTQALLNDGSINWTYDALGRLTSETIVSTTWGNESGSWSYDAAGNRLDPGATFGPDHRQLTFDTESFAYDAAGNMATSFGRALTFDERNRLVATPFASFRYNGLGNRDQVNTNVSRSYVYDGENIVHIFSGASFAHHFTFGLATDELLFARNDTASRFFVTDEQGSVIAITNETGGVLQSWAYDAWGNRIHASAVGGVAFGGINFNPFSFQAKETLIDFVGLYHFRARAYRPDMGRFIQKDPARGSSFHPASRHPYQFAFNRPTQFVDPTGLSATQYGLMIKENKAAEGAGILIAGLSAFGGTNLAFVGNFLDRRLQHPGETTSASATQAIASAEQDIETVLDEFESWYEDNEASIAQGLNDGAGYGHTLGGYWLNYAVLGIPPF
ncbi:MAG: VCBS repeat-containing protein [Bryobacterales bacterium]|nr:VCBS repeat-containing protein [Bryobacterales bacterium]